MPHSNQNLNGKKQKQRKQIKRIKMEGKKVESNK